MADLPLALPSASLAPLALAAFDAEGKIPRALAALGPIDARATVLLDADRGFRARQLLGLGAHLTAVTTEPELLEAGLDGVAGSVCVQRGRPDETGLADASADVIVSFWSAFRGPSETGVREADRILRPGGRLLVVHDYGRDDVSPIRPDDLEVTGWGRREGWFLRCGFRIRVLHCWWTFESLEDAERLLGELCPPEAAAAIRAGMRRPRLSHKVAVYHRSRPADPGRVAR